MKKLAAIILSVALTACGGAGALRSGGEENVGPYPTSWKSIVASYIRNNYVDPHSVIDSEAAPPFRNNKLFFDSWTVCIRNNAKNQFGGYTGRKISQLEIRKGLIVLVHDAYYECQHAQFEPFPL